MKNLKLLIGFICGLMILFSFQGCYPYYGFGNSGVDPIVFTKPIYADSALVTTFIGGKFSHSIDSAYSHPDEQNYFGQLYCSQTHTNKYYNFSYGAYGYYGSYKVVEIEQFKGNKSYYGGGLSSELNLNIPLTFVDLRIVGIKGTFYYENGNFSNFRRIAAKQQLISGISSSLFAYNISYTFGFDFKLKNSSIGFDSSCGFTQPINESDIIYTLGMNMHYTKNNYSAYIQYTNCLFAIGGEYSLGFNYRLK